MSKQSSIEWLIEQLAIIDKNDPYYAKILAQAKQMHKEEIESAFYKGAFVMAHSDEIFPREESEKYYQKIYGGSPKTSDN